MNLLPDDLIATGTPPVVGLAQDPPVLLKPGHVLRCGIEGLDEQCHRVVAFSG
ncbi:2-keto-4-pentenoate hydratase/2-oxohepta-3-ene-1,7-dioic acid hydratase in catechol pathway [Skermanella aerolata]